MVERIGALIGLIMACAAVVTAIVVTARLVAGETADRLLPNQPGDEVSSGKAEWLLDPPTRTLVDLDELHDQMLTIEARLREATEDDLAIEYRATVHPGSGALIGATGEATVARPLDPRRVAAAGFSHVETHDPIPTAPSYPTTDPPPDRAGPSSSSPAPAYPTVSPPSPPDLMAEPQTLMLEASTPSGWLSVSRVGDEYHISFSVIVDFDEE